MTTKLLMVLAVALALGACTPGGSNSNTSPGGTPSAGGFSVPLNQTLADSRVLAPPPPHIKVQCPPGSFDLTKQTLSAPGPGVTGTMTIDQVGPTVELADGETTLTVKVPDGTKYAGTFQPLGPTCGNSGPAKPISVTVGLTYRAVIEAPNPNQASTCVYRSRADYSSFSLTVTGTPLDGAIQALLDGKIKEELLKQVDFQTANQWDIRTRNTPLPSGTDPRCEWRELPPDGKVNR